MDNSQNSAETLNFSVSAFTFDLKCEDFKSNEDACKVQFWRDLCVCNAFDGLATVMKRFTLPAAPPERAAA